MTIRDVARETGVSTFTVSKALSGKAGVASGTRERVEAVAARLGYAINAAASLMGQLRGAPRGGRQLAVAVLAENYSSTDFLAPCEELGLQGHWFRPSEFASPEEASRVIWHRGISGLVVHSEPWSEEGRRRFDWSRFSVVKPSRAMPDIACHLVQHSAFDFMSKTLVQVVRHGYRRLAVLVMRTHSPQDDDARYGALMNFEARKLPPGVTCTWREIEGQSPTHLDARTLAWLRAERPDVIVAYHWTMIYPLREAGFEIPGQVALAAVLGQAEPAPGAPWVSGCDLQSAEMDRRMLIILRDMIGRGERGFSAHPMEHVIEPEWIEGETLPEVAKTR